MAMSPLIALLKYVIVIDWFNCCGWFKDEGVFRMDVDEGDSINELLMLGVVTAVVDVTWDDELRFDCVSVSKLFVFFSSNNKFII
jgi:hypothetical protein